MSSGMQLSLNHGWFCGFVPLALNPLLTHAFLAALLCRPWACSHTQPKSRVRLVLGCHLGWCAVVWMSLCAVGLCTVVLFCTEVWLVGDQFEHSDQQLLLQGFAQCNHLCWC